MPHEGRERFAPKKHRSPALKHPPKIRGTKPEASPRPPVGRDTAELALAQNQGTARSGLDRFKDRFKGQFSGK